MAAIKTGEGHGKTLGWVGSGAIRADLLGAEMLPPEMMEGKVDADEHFAASRCPSLFSAMLLACRKRQAQTAPLQHFFCVSLSSASPPPVPPPPLLQPHLTIRGYKEQCCLLAQQPLRLSSLRSLLAAIDNEQVL